MKHPHPKKVVRAEQIRDRTQCYHLCPVRSLRKSGIAFFGNLTAGVAELLIEANAVWVHETLCSGSNRAAVAKAASISPLVLRKHLALVKLRVDREFASRLSQYFHRYTRWQRKCMKALRGRRGQQGLPRPFAGRQAAGRLRQSSGRTAISQPSQRWQEFSWSRSIACWRERRRGRCCWGERLRDQINFRSRQRRLGYSGNPTP